MKIQLTVLFLSFLCRLFNPTKANKANICSLIEEQSTSLISPFHVCTSNNSSRKIQANLLNNRKKLSKITKTPRDSSSPVQNLDARKFVARISHNYLQFSASLGASCQPIAINRIPRAEYTEKCSLQRRRNDGRGWRTREKETSGRRIGARLADRGLEAKEVQKSWIS